MQESKDAATPSRTVLKAAEREAAADASRTEAKRPTTIRKSAFYAAMISDLALLGLLRCRMNVDGR